MNADRIDRITREALALGVIGDNDYERIRASMTPDNAAAERVITMLGDANRHARKGDGAMAQVYARSAQALNFGVKA